MFQPVPGIEPELSGAVIEVQGLPGQRLGFIGRHFLLPPGKFRYR